MLIDEIGPLGQFRIAVHFGILTQDERREFSRIAGEWRAWKSGVLGRQGVTLAEFEPRLDPLQSSLCPLRFGPEFEDPLS